MVVAMHLHWYDYMVCVAVLGQLLFLYQAGRHYRFALSKATRRQRLTAQPMAALVIPCKGLDSDFRENMNSFLHLDYDNYRIFFVVGEASDPAYKELRDLTDKAAAAGNPRQVQILVSGPCTSCSQKIHNLLYAIQHIPADTEMLVFADSDAQVHSDWLARLVWPLRNAKHGIATGYRWFVPTQKNLATLVLSALNASVAQLLGNTGLNRAWGGSMAMRLADFRGLKLAEKWKKTFSDDLSASREVRKHHMKVTFVPSCLVASPVATTWPDLLEFGRRQFLIARVYSPIVWCIGLISSLASVVGLWGLLALVVYVWRVEAPYRLLYAAALGVYFAGQVLRAVLRQIAAFRLLPEHASSLKAAAWADIAGCWLWAPLLMVIMLSSAFGQIITWRGIRYRLISPTRTEVLDKGRAEAARP